MKQPVQVAPGGRKTAQAPPSIHLPLFGASAPGATWGGITRGGTTKWTASRILRDFAIAPTLLLVLSAALAGQQPQGGRAGDDEPSPYAEIAVGPETIDGQPNLVTEPPDGRWQVDEEGIRYIISRYPKRDGEYKWIDQEAGLVRLGRLMAFEAIDHDADYFYFRIDETQPYVPPAGPTEEEIEAVEKSYRMEVPEVDRLHLVPWEEGLPKSGQWRNGFAIADMNEDGHLDLVLPPARKTFAQPVIALGDGAGNWKGWEQTRFPDLPYDYGDVAVSDLDGDGHLDMVLAMHLTGLVALRGDGNGQFTEWREGLPLRSDAVKRRPGPPSTTTWQGHREQLQKPGETPATETIEEARGANFSARAVETVDWNGDGRLDILALSEGPTSVETLLGDKKNPLGKAIFLNGGDGSWKLMGGPGAILGDVIELVDLDGDGHVDFVTDSSMIGNAEILNYWAGETWETASLPAPRGRILIHSVAVADFDQDSRPDVAVAFKAHEMGTERYGIDIFYGQPQRGFRRESILGLPAGPTRGLDWMSAGDVEGDGDADLVVLTREGEVWILLNEGDGIFARELGPEVEPAPDHYYCSGYRAELRDLDGDGANELVAIFAGEPGSEGLLVGQLAARCPARGAIRAWKIAPGPAPDALGEAPSDSSGG